MSRETADAKRSRREALRRFRCEERILTRVTLRLAGVHVQVHPRKLDLPEVPSSYAETQAHFKFSIDVARTYPGRVISVFQLVTGYPS